MLSPETKELFEGFEKRMRFVNIVKYIRKHSFTDEIKEFFPNDQDIMDNLVLSVLVFIMDSTLRYGEKCTKTDISRFLGEMSEVYGYPAEKSDSLTDYIVTDILRNGGMLVEFNTYMSSTEKFMPQSTIILNDNNGSYTLTDEVYEFLFRTKGIDSELDFSVTRFKLNEFIKRGNYSKALRESRELVSRVRSLKTRMDDFVLRCKMNVSKVSVDEYDEIISQVKAAFDDESRQINDIRSVVSTKLQAMLDAVSNGVHIENAEAAEKEISEILDNIETVIDEQTRIYNKKFSLTECYEQLLDEDFSYILSGRFDFEKVIMEPMQKMERSEFAALPQLLSPLFIPVLPRHFSIENFYMRQKKLSGEENTATIDLTGAEENDISDEDIRNSRYIAITGSLFGYLSERENADFSGYVNSLTNGQKEECTQNNALPDVIM
ncbi:MAG: hypothetical protein ACI4JB_03465, partial [Porcipelethomonas sp.]